MSNYEKEWIPGYQEIIKVINTASEKASKDPVLESYLVRLIDIFNTADRGAFSYLNSNDHFKFVSLCSECIKILSDLEKRNPSKNLMNIYKECNKFLTNQIANCQKRINSNTLNLSNDVWGLVDNYLSFDDLLKLRQTSYFFFEKNNIKKILLEKLKIKIEEEIKNIKPKVFCGRKHTLCNIDQHLYSMGNNLESQLGFSHPVKIESFSPILISLLEKNEKILKIATKENLNLLLTQLGEVLVWGERCEKTRAVTLQLEINDSIVDFGVGPNYFILLTQQGKIFACGDNTSGQLGLGDNNNRKRPSEIKLSNLALEENDQIINIITGYNHNFFITQSGRVFAWGLNNYGQLGLGNNSNYSSPTEMIKILELIKEDKIQQLAAGNTTTLILTQKGRVFTCGISNGLNQNVSSPTEMKLETLSLGNDKIIKIIAGYEHNFFLTQQGQIFAWGDNSAGQLGLKNKKIQHFPTPTTINLDSLKLNKEDKIIDIAAGASHTFFISAEGRIFTCGSNVYGQLGQGQFSADNYSYLKELTFKYLKEIQSKLKKLKNKLNQINEISQKEEIKIPTLKK